MGDIELLVDSFYGKIKTDDLLKSVFNNVIKNNWSEHLEKMNRFWQTVLLNEHTYNGAPFIPHAFLPINEVHFERWLDLFDNTIDMHFEGQTASKAKWQGRRMAEMFQLKMKHIQSTNQTPLK